MSTLGIRRSALTVPATALVLLLVVAPTAVMADSSRGRAGPYVINDTAADPGVSCNYNESWSAIESITVRAPQVFARDVTAEEDAEYVGWKFVIKAKHGRHVRQIYASPFQNTRATETESAGLTDMTASPTITSFAHHFVVIKLYWYGPDGGWPTGWAKHRVENNVRRTASDPVGTVTRFCDTGYA